MLERQQSLFGSSLTGKVRQRSPSSGESGPLQGDTDHTIWPRKKALFLLRMEKIGKNWIFNDEQ